MALTTFSRRLAGPFFLAAGTALAGLPAPAPGADAPARVLTYQMPAPGLVDLVDAPRPPEVSIGPNRRWILVMEPRRLPSIADLSPPEVLLAGYRIDPTTNGPSRPGGFSRLTFQTLADTVRHPVTPLPPGVLIDHLQWSPDGLYAAFTVNDGKTIELWVTETEGTVTKRVLRQPLNALNVPFRWTPDSKSLICTIIPEDRPAAPVAAPVPTGPLVRERSGDPGPAPFREDLLRTPHDEVLFEHYLTSQLMRAEIGGKRKRVGTPGIITDFSVSPDGRFLLVQLIHRPFSFYVPARGFPRWIEVWDLEGNRVQRIADVPAQDPLGAPARPRDFQWRADAPSTVVWVDAAKGEEPAPAGGEAVVALDPPFAGEPRVLAQVPGEVTAVQWGTESLAFVRERDSGSGTSPVFRTWRFQPGDPGVKARSVPDPGGNVRHPEAGRFLAAPNAQGHDVLLIGPEGKTVYAFGSEDTEEGSQAFLIALDLETGETRRYWQSEEPDYEEPRLLLDSEATWLVTRRETPESPPDFLLRSMTAYSNDTMYKEPLIFDASRTDRTPLPREVIQVPGPGGKTIRGLLASPAKADSTGPPPLLLWLPSRDAAPVSPYRFEPSGWDSPFAWAAQGFAVLVVPGLAGFLDGSDDGENAAERLVNAALAAVDAATANGKADPERMAVGGDGSGATAAAVILSHTGRFRAGIACGGVYNPTLAPFGSGSETRTLWQAPGWYESLSPLQHADGVRTPLLILQGEADAAPARDAERYFDALTGLGAPARLVLFPHERTQLRARESVLHALWEVQHWLAAHVEQGAPPGEDPGKP